jgi:hypothetical protein
MTDTDEFIVFGANVETTFDDNQTSNIPRYNLNKLYTFSKTNDNSIDNFKQINSNQVCLKERTKKKISINIFQSLYSSSKDIFLKIKLPYGK